MEFVPPKRVFQEPVKDARVRHEDSAYTLPDFLHATRTKTGGMASVFQGHPFPRKGFIYAEGVMAVAKAKRVTLALFQPITAIKKGLIGFLESYLYNYCRLVDMLFADCERIPYLHYEYYGEFSKAVLDFTKEFLIQIGISETVASKTGLILATIFENDDAYKTPLIDVFSETTKEQLMKNPRKEVLRLVHIYAERSHHINDEGTGAGNRMVSMGKLASFILLIPTVKKAFRKALEPINFAWFQYDEWEEYWALARSDYEVKGLPFSIRREMQIAKMTEYAKTLNPGKEIKRIDNEDGTTNIIAE